MQGNNFIVTLCLIGLAYTLPSFTPDGENAPQFFSPAGPKLHISPATIPDGKYGSTYDGQHLKVTGGKGDYSFSVSGGSLPPGMSLSTDGALSGTPTAAGTYSFTVTATSQSGHGDGKDKDADSGSQDYALAIARATLTIIADPQTKEHGAPDPPLSYSSSGFVNGDGIEIFTGKLSRAPGEAVGRYAITKGNLSAGRNYTISFTGNTLTISAASEKKDPKISPTSVAGGQYGSAYTTQNLKVTGGDGSYTFSVSKGSLPPGISLSNDGTFSGTPTAVGTYSFTVTATGQSGDSNSASHDYALAIAQAPLTITAANATTTYGGAIPPLTAAYTGFVNGDDASSLGTPPSIVTSATSSSPAGAYPITISGAVDSNYKITYKPGTLTINPAALAVTADPQTKVQDSADPALTYTASGFVNGDNTGIITGSLTRAPGENVGKYAITIGSLSAGHNYTINYTGNYLTITASSQPPPTQPPGQQHITWTQNLLVGCNASTKIPLTASASSGLPVIYSVADSTIATVSGNVLTLLRPGRTVITASQPGDAKHAAAQPVTDTLLYQSSSLIRQHWSDVIIFDNTSGNFVQWQWYKNGEAVQGATDPYYSEPSALQGQYYVIATTASGQQIQTCALTLTGDSAAPAGIQVHPNPVKAGAAINVTSNYTAAALQGAILQVIDLSGKVWKEVTSVQPLMQVTMPPAHGICILRLLLANGQMASTNVLVLD